MLWPCTEFLTLNLQRASSNPFTFNDFVNDPRARAVGGPSDPGPQGGHTSTYSRILGVPLHFCSETCASIQPAAELRLPGSFPGRPSGDPQLPIHGLCRVKPADGLGIGYFVTILVTFLARLKNSGNISRGPLVYKGKVRP